VENLTGKKWCSRPELNGDKQFRKLRLYPFELREHKFLPAYPLSIFCQVASEQQRSIVLPRPFYLVLQCTFFGEDGENVGVGVGELMFRHSKINQNQFAFGFEKRFMS
jgi:hypothetical protein